MAAYGASRTLNQVIPQPCVVDETTTWFIWSSEPEPDKPLASAVRVEKPEIRSTSFLGSLAVSGMARLEKYLPKKAKFSKIYVRPPVVIENDLLSIELASPVDGSLLPSTLDEAVKSLVALVERGELEKWLDCIQDLAEKFLPANSPLRSDPAIQQLLMSLPVVLDKAFVRTFGTEKLIRQVLASLKLPDEKVVAIVRKLACFVVDEGARANLEQIIRLVVQGEDK
ncbi:hypothetical protein [Pseudomonas sp. R5(2019)]|uniref:hypothetical protein n=1 Tax=Pseudomonas sp. R5(2019) TaxID=2697566 RepID=UPI0014125EBB|nr:hypothetical protein [Pseudomonas sp. R5(2019)]NBA94854.1 hypothetical protein [Pseudomonas sp. R5(2019)]